MRQIKINTQNTSTISTFCRKSFIYITSLFCVAISTTSVAQQGQLLWEENFNILNTEIWSIDEGNGCQHGNNMCGWGNGELQSYSESNVSIEEIPNEAGNNALVLQARPDNLNDRAFSSGKINSLNKLAIQYGIIETRLRVPNLTTGLWPAFWMLGTSTKNWPSKGEIDIMEMGHRWEARQAWLTHNGDPSDDENPLRRLTTLLALTQYSMQKRHAFPEMKRAQPAQPTKAIMHIFLRRHLPIGLSPTVYTGPPKKLCFPLSIRGKKPLFMIRRFL